jgi:hypothetical protein
MVLRRAFPVLILFAGLLLMAGEPPARAGYRDGSHDFDSERGMWKLHIRRLLHPLTGSADWVEYEGTKTDIPFWGGKADIAEVRADGAAGHLEFIALRLCDSAAHQWSLSFTSAGTGTLAAPLYGEMRNGRIEFIDADTANGRNILVRFVMQAEGLGKASSEQYFSDDGGHSWELNWVNTYTLKNG